LNIGAQTEALARQRERVMTLPNFIVASYFLITNQLQRKIVKGKITTRPITMAATASSPPPQQSIIGKIMIRLISNIWTRLFCKSSEKMEELPNSSIHLVVTSPPYNVGKDYNQNLSIEQYRSLLKAVFKETYRALLDDGGRVCTNVANLRRKPYIPLHSYIIEDMLEIGFFNER
jgi:hypothetical protein